MPLAIRLQVSVHLCSQASNVGLQNSHYLAVKAVVAVHCQVANVQAVQLKFVPQRQQVAPELVQVVFECGHHESPALAPRYRSRRYTVYAVVQQQKVLES